MGGGYFCTFLFLLSLVFSFLHDHFITSPHTLTWNAVRHYTAPRHRPLLQHPPLPFSPPGGSDRRPRQRPPRNTDSRPQPPRHPDRRPRQRPPRRPDRRPRLHDHPTPVLCDAEGISFVGGGWGGVEGGGDVSRERKRGCEWEGGCGWEGRWGIAWRGDDECVVSGGGEDVEC